MHDQVWARRIAERSRHFVRKNADRRKSGRPAVSQDAEGDEIDQTHHGKRPRAHAHPARGDRR